jgi:type IV secretion system protein VirB6
MIGACTSTPPATGFIGSMTNYIDCQAQTLGSGAWQALAMPGSTLALVLTGFLTIFIALIGYNLLLGTGPSVRSGTLAFVKAGAIFALATSWPAYRTLVYIIVVDGPGQIVSEIGPRSGIVGSDGTLLQRLDGADQGLSQLAILGPGAPSVDQAADVPPPPFIGFSAFALGGSRILYLLTAIAGLAAVRIIAALMLAIGPFFIAFLMFDSTRSLFEGWIRVLAGAALAAIGVSLTLGLELALLEPWLAQVLSQRVGGQALPGMPVELFVLVCLFAIIMLAAVIACARVAHAFRLAPLLRIIPERDLSRQVAERAHDQIHRPRAEIERSRASAVADVLLAMNRRESALSTIGQSLLQPTVNGLSAVTEVGSSHAGQRPSSRRTWSRVSAGARRRDGAA